MSNKNLALWLAALLLVVALWFFLYPSIVKAPSTPAETTTLNTVSSNNIVSTNSISSLSNLSSSSLITTTKTVASTWDKVWVNYIWKFSDWKVFDTSLETIAKQNGLYMTGRNYSPLSFTLWGWEMIKGFDTAVLGMKVWETKSVTLLPKDAYWESNPALIKSLPMSEFKAANIEPKVWDYVPVSVGVDCVIKSVETENVTIDCNSPMAWKTLNFDITLVSIN